MAATPASLTPRSKLRADIKDVRASYVRRVLVSENLDEWAPVLEEAGLLSTRALSEEPGCLDAASAAVFAATGRDPKRDRALALLRKLETADAALGTPSRLPADAGDRMKEFRTLARA